MDGARMRGEIMRLSLESDVRLDVSAQINDSKVLSKSLAFHCFFNEEKMMVLPDVGRNPCPVKNKKWIYSAQMFFFFMT